MSAQFLLPNMEQKVQRLCALSTQFFSSLCKSTRLITFALSYLFFAFSTLTLAIAQEFELIKISVGFYNVEVEVANTEATRALGLMHRKHLAPYKGMLFIFPNAGRHCMWMRNTLIPLSVAFLDDEARIINIEEMAAQTEENHCASTTARYALEMNAHWFTERGFKAGTKISGIKH